jgi:hypothetical protein
MIRDPLIVINRIAIGHGLVKTTKDILGKHLAEPEYFLISSAQQYVAPFVVEHLLVEHVIWAKEGDGHIVVYDIDRKKARTYARDKQVIRDYMMLYIKEHIDRVIDATVQREDCESDEDYENAKTTMRSDMLFEARCLAEFYQD